MFTGLIQSVGLIEEVMSTKEGKSFWIRHDLPDSLSKGDSVSIDGVCLTVVEQREKVFRVDSVWMTLEKTNLHAWQEGRYVNLELALRFTDRLGGHIVTGHVNGVGEIVEITPRGLNYEILYQIPKNLMTYMMNEGSVAIDGISLTVAKINDEQNQILITIIPHTYLNTQISKKERGDRVHIEPDVLMKYVERMTFRERHYGHTGILSESTQGH